MHHLFFQPKQSNVKHKVRAGLKFWDVFVILPISKNEKSEGEDEVIIAHIKDGGLAYIRDIDFKIAARQSGS